MDIIADEKDLKKVAERFGLGKIENYERLSGGIINDTFKITTSKGVFVAQRIHDIFNGGVLRNAWYVSMYLSGVGFSKIPKIIERPCSKISTKIRTKTWKVSQYIDHDKVIKNESLITKAAETLAEFHNLMSNFAGKSHLRPTISDFHKTKKIIQKLHNFTKGHSSKLHKYRMRAKRARNQADFILENAPKHYLPRGLPKIVIHGDPKFENFLFKDGEAAAIIDLDTLMTGNELIDLGDALRNWSMINHTKFDKNVFDAALKSYKLKNNKDYINETSALNATALITMELAARFLIDYFEEIHFKWDDKKYPSASAHNLARCNKVLAYYQNLTKYL